MTGTNHHTTTRATFDASKLSEPQIVEAAGQALWLATMCDHQGLTQLAALWNRLSQQLVGIAEHHGE